MSDSRGYEGLVRPSHRESCQLSGMIVGAARLTLSRGVSGSACGPPTRSCWQSARACWCGFTRCAIRQVRGAGAAGTPGSYASLRCCITWGASTVARPFDAKRPCDLALRAVIEDQAFWAEELKGPAVLVLARANRMSDRLGSDAHGRSSTACASNFEHCLHVKKGFCSHNGPQQSLVRCHSRTTQTIRRTSTTTP